MFAWNVFRYGPPCTAPCGAFASPPTIEPWPDEQFPMETVLAGGSQTFFKQVIPDLSGHQVFIVGSPEFVEPASPRSAARAPPRITRTRSTGGFPGPCSIPAKPAEV